VEVKILKESGYEEAMLGISLSWASNPERAKQIAPNLAHKQGGHNKFLESIIIWLDVTFPRDIWSEADTYRLSTKQSESTMHTLNKQYLTQENFDKPIPQEIIDVLNKQIDRYNKKEIGIDDLKHCLPEGFLQRRIWCMSYKELQNICFQRGRHKMPQWKVFIDSVLEQIEHPEFIIKKEA